MRTIRHRAAIEITARSGYDDNIGTMNWFVTTPWEDDNAGATDEDESDNHGHPVLPQLTFDVEGPDGDVIEDVTLSALDTWRLYQALRETYVALEVASPQLKVKAIEDEQKKRAGVDL